jgi:ParB family chromosome partitioning protein
MSEPIIEKNSTVKPSIVTPPSQPAAKRGLGRGLESLLNPGASSQSQEKEQIVPSGAAAFTSPVAMLVPSNVKAAPASVSPAAELAKPVPATDIDPSKRIWVVPIEKVHANKEQPRKIFADEDLLTLSMSLKEKGFLLPIVVRKTATKDFEIIAGERRWRAAQLAGMHEVPVIIKEASNSEALELALIENIQRQDLNPMEEGEAYQVLAEKYHLSQAQIAEKVSKDRSTVANLMRLTALHPNVRHLIRSGDLHLGQAKVLLGLPDQELQYQTAKKVVNLRLSVRATEKLVQKIQSKEVDLEEQTSVFTESNLRPVINELQKKLGTKVEVSHQGEKSQLTIHFYTLANFNEFVEKLRKL